VKVDVHDRLEAVEPAAWNRLHASSRLRSPFLSFTWQEAWTRAFVSERRLEVRTVKDADGSLVAVLPLYEVASGVMELVGGADVSDYLDLLSVADREEAAWAALLSSRGDDRDAWVLHAVPAASPTLTVAPALAAAAGLDAAVSVEERCPVLALPESWDAYLARLPGKHRHELQRKVRRLEREAPDAHVSSAAEPADVERRFDDFLHLHRRSRAGKARFMDERMETFFRRVVMAFSAEDGVRLWLLDTPTGPMAAFVCLEWDGTVGLYNSGFDPDRAALAPGIVLLSHVIRDAIARGKRRFDFLRGEERYKYEFGPVPEDVCALRVEPRAPGASA
jgi:CelD/BcsL family acetyltransferase involved in cellulose biosynthesis